MKNKKAFFASAVTAACLALLCAGCSSGKSESDLDSPKPDMQDGNAAVEAQQSESAVSTPKQTAELYYQYLSDYMEEKSNTYINEGLADTEPRELFVSGYNEDYYWDIGVETDRLGYLSAFIEDFDHDGTVEMLAAKLSDRETFNTKFKELVFSPDQTELNDETSRENCLVLSAKLFDIDEQGNAYEAYSEELAMIPGTSWGSIYMGIEKVGDDYYVFTNYDSENLSTYGTNYFVVSNISDGTIDWDYCNQREAREKLNVGDLDISATTLSTLQFGDSPEETREYLGNRLICCVDVNYDRQGGTNTTFYLDYQAVDYTNLKENMETLGANWTQTELPQGGAIELPTNNSAEAYAAGLIERMTAQTGIALEKSGVDELDDGKFEVEYQSSDYQTVSIVWDTANDQLFSLKIETDNYDDSQWYTLKDYVFSCEDFGLSADVKAKFMGEVDFLDDPVDCGDYRIGVDSVLTTWFTITRISD